MNKDLKASARILINALAKSTWMVLTNPEYIKLWLYGTEADTDWKVGSSISFRGEYQGHVYHDRGNVLENRENELLKYNYWAQYSGLEDSAENYSLVTYKIEAKEGMAELTWLQEGFASEKGQKHTEEGLPALLQSIKELAEKQ